ncbi:MAG TPA: sugar ABC transporter ATP-binding protein [Anaerovoracaceae bacterium]|nr:sugar ABC transporter ATP-binding protein [Anaerovoracaceae bacterium]
MATILKLQNVTKRYPGVLALDDVSLSFKKGEVHALMGENGAGKSTLIKAVSGAISVDQGSFEVDGRQYDALTPAESIKAGISVIYQEFNLVPSLSIAENIFLGKKIGGKIKVDFAEMHRRAAEVFAQFDIEIDTHTMVSRLSTAQMQIVEIAKAISKNAKVIIMDEPTATLAMAEVDYLFKIIRRLKESGITILYISHRIDEVFEISDRISVLRDGRYIATRNTAETNRHELVNLMVGRQLDETYPARELHSDEIVLETRGLCGNGVYDIDMKLHRGEILGLGGLMGAGRSELAKVLFGAAKKDNGEIWLDGRKVDIRSPYQAITLGIGLIPEDRKREGAFLEYAIDWNISIMSVRQMAKHGVVRQADVDELSKTYFKKIKIVAPSSKQLVKNLSGGNQQKVVLAKVLAARTRIIIFDEPTRGIDVGAKQEIYNLMAELCEEGISIIMITSDMEELLGMSDRILVLHEGRKTGELSHGEFSQSRVLELASAINC